MGGGLASPWLSVLIPNTIHEVGRRIRGLDEVLSEASVSCLLLALARPGWMDLTESGTPFLSPSPQPQWLHLSSSPLGKDYRRSTVQLCAISTGCGFRYNHFPVMQPWESHQVMSTLQASRSTSSQLCSMAILKIK